MMALLRCIRAIGLVFAAMLAALATGGAAHAAPTVSSALNGVTLTNTGTAAGGSAVIIVGSGFTGVTSVKFGGVSASFSFIDDNEIIATTPADGSPVTPSVSSITPNHGGTGGGTGVIITGSNFEQAVDVSVTTPGGTGTLSGGFIYLANGVSIGGTPATGLNVTSNTSLTAVTPLGVIGTADVVVTMGSVSSTNGTNLYTYVDGGPSISTVGPTEGLTTGGNQIILTGSNFVPGVLHDGTTPATTVTIGGNPATNVQVNSNGVSLSAKVPAASNPLGGAVSVVVTTVAGSTSSTYKYLPPLQPSVISVLDTTSGQPGGSTAGGNQVKISGTNFIGATSVTFGGVAVSGFNVVSDGEIDTTTPPSTNGAAGTVDVVVTVPSATPSTSAIVPGDHWTYVIPTPSITAIAPNVGVTSGGTKVTITGQYFTGATAVKFGSTSATFTVNSTGTSITATSPASNTTGTVDIRVTTPTVTSPVSGGGTSPISSADQFTYGTPPPTVTSVSPPGGTVNGGTNVTINGTGFAGGTVTGVTFGGVAATNVAFVSDTQITATTPAHGAGAVSVSVTILANSVSLTGTGANLYTYGASAPTVTSITPNTGSTLGGTQVTIVGTAFSGTPQVTINGVQAGQVTLIDSTHIQAVTPAGTGTNVPVIVTTSFGSNSPANIYSYVVTPPPTVAAPTVTAILPTSGSTAGGTPVTITGTNLTGATAVTIGGKPATSVVVVSATQITAITPPGALGPADVSVTTPGGTGTGAGLYTYVAPVPVVSSILPNTGTTLGGTPVTITGTGFTGATSVTIGGVAATNVTVQSDTTISAKTGAHAAGPASVVVTTPGGTSTGGTNLFTYVATPLPTVLAISPNHGPTLGGTQVTITGSNFTGATSVTIGGAAATFVTVVGPTQITATTAANAAGTFDVVVTTPPGAGTGSKLFTYFVTPVVTGMSPNVGPTAGGTNVTITGSGFIGATAVKFGSTPATNVSVVNGTTITATSPAGTGTVDVTVTAPFATSLTGTADKFTYLPVPVVTGVSPATGLPTGGTSVTITGTGFTGATSVKFGGTTASFTVNPTGTSITATSPPGTGTVDITVTTAGGTSTLGASDKFTYAKATTSLNLTSTPNPSHLGQTVTFTATVTGNSPTGNVTFSYKGTTLGTAPLVNGVATFTINSLPVGSNLITASYPGDANNAPDPQSVMQVVNQTNDSANLRLLQLSVMPIVTNLSGQAISGAIDNAIGAGFGGNPELLTPNGSGFTYYFNGDTQAQAQAQEQANAAAGQGSLSQAQGDRPLSLTPQAKIDNEFSALGYAGPPVVKAAPVVTPVPRQWLAWIDVRGADFNRTTFGEDLKGTQVNAIAGLTRRFSPSFIVGVLGGYEHFDFSSQAYNGVLKGNGFTAGGYLGWRLTSNLRFDAGGAWSDILADDTSGTASGSFTGHRWFASAGLTGTTAWGTMMVEPSARVFSLWEQEDAYTDSLGTLQSAHTFDTGRASAGAKFSHPFLAGVGILTPYAGVYADYYFSNDNANLIGLTTTPLLLKGWGARATGGITATFGGGALLGVGGEFSGIGSDTHIWNLQVRGAVPF